MPGNWPRLLAHPRRAGRGAGLRSNCRTRGAALPRRARRSRPAPVSAADGGIDGAGRAVGLRSRTQCTPAAALCRTAARHRARAGPLLRHGHHPRRVCDRRVRRPSNGASGQGRGQSRPSGEPRRGQRDHAGEHPHPLRSAPRPVDRRKPADRYLGELRHCSLWTSRAAAGAARGRAAAAHRSPDLSLPRRADRGAEAAIPGNALASVGAVAP